MFVCMYVCVIRLFSVIRSEAIIHWLHFGNNRHQILYKKPLRHVIINLFIVKLINAVINTESLSLDTYSSFDGCRATNALHFYFHPTSLAFR